MRTNPMVAALRLDEKIGRWGLAVMGVGAEEPVFFNDW